MPPRTRGIKASKTLKENLGIVEKGKIKAVDKNVKPARKALADKTNSASDENVSFEQPKTGHKKPISALKNHDNCVSSRPRREKRLPNRFEENHVLKSLSNNKESDSAAPNNVPTESKTPVNNNEQSPFKTPQKRDSTSLSASRPTRVSRLPSRFKDHSISPSKFIPVQPIHSSTPIVQNAVKKSFVKTKTTNLVSKNITSEVRSTVKSNDVPKSQTLQKTKVSSRKKADNDISSSLKQTNEEFEIRDTRKTKPSPIKQDENKSFTEITKKPAKGNKKKSEVEILNADTNNNPHQGRTLRARKKPPIIEQSSIDESDSNLELLKKLKTAARPSSSQKNKITVTSTIAKKINTSFRVLENKKQSEQEVNNKADVYEFTFDPDEEPPPQKKKRKRVVKKKPSKPKTVIFKNNYEKNVSKALSVLKNNVAKKAIQPSTEETVNNKTNVPVQPQKSITSSTKGGLTSGTNNQQLPTNVVSTANPNPQTVGNTVLTQIPIQNSMADKSPAPVPVHNSLRIEDIVLDFQTSPVHHEIDYSPVNSPHRPKTPIEIPSIVVHEPSPEGVNSHDPLNLRDNLSFFDDKPIANSSMNVSVRHPHASPWRVDYQNLPIKWQVNSYVKSNMTPAVECSYVNFNDSNRKKHVYTNLVPQSNEELPEIVEKDAPNLVQTSIISFIKEVAERSANKKRGRSRSTTPATLFNDLINDETKKNPVLNQTHRQLATPKKTQGKNPAAAKTPVHETNKNSNVPVKENGREHLKRKCNSNENTVPAKSPRKILDNTYFGFDDTDEIDQENVSPQKLNNPKVQALRSRARAALKEINEQCGPVRAKNPISVKSAAAAINADMSSKLYDQMKAATDAPVLADENAVDNIEITEVNNEGDCALDEENSQSVHLFEDIELIHLFKQPQRKSYGKGKKVTFQPPSDSDTQDSDVPAKEQEDSSEEDDLHDLTYGIPTVVEKKKRKKLTKKQKLTKKEQAEAEAWVAGFNSMCEEVEDFPLVVE